MHMSDALLSPEVGAITMTAAGAMLAYSSCQLKKNWNDQIIPFMGVMGAFIFAAQMINFSIPGTGSSGHLGGGMLLAILLGPWAGITVMASILFIQALFFADGGLLALGANIMNLGFFPCFVAYPLIYRTIAGKRNRPLPMIVGSVISVIVALQLGAFFVVLETFFSGISELPFVVFLALMQPIHLAIAIVEAIVTALVLLFILKADPRILSWNRVKVSEKSIWQRGVFVFLLLAIILGGMGSWFASQNPDGLEWSVARITGRVELHEPQSGLHRGLHLLQGKISFLADYDFPKESGQIPKDPELNNSKSLVKLSATFSGIAGSLLSLSLVVVIGIFLRFGGRKISRKS
jgi:cobalt/nickel transport system permease protein